MDSGTDSKALGRDALAELYDAACAKVDELSRKLTAASRGVAIYYVDDVRIPRTIAEADDAIDYVRRRHNRLAEDVAAGPPATYHNPEMWTRDRQRALRSWRAKLSELKYHRTRLQAAADFDAGAVDVQAAEAGAQLVGTREKVKRLETEVAALTSVLAERNEKIKELGRLYEEARHAPGGAIDTKRKWQAAIHNDFAFACVVYEDLAAAGVQLTPLAQYHAESVRRSTPLSAWEKFKAEDLPRIRAKIAARDAEHAEAATLAAGGSAEGAERRVA